NVMLNKVKTGFESFEKDSLSTASPEEYQKRREELRRQIYALYADFNSVGWWWTWNAYIMKYDSNLQQTVHLLDRPWRDYLSDSPQELVPADQRKPVMPDIDKPFGTLREQRDAIVEHMASLFQ